MKVLVTGATGLVGSALCDALIARGDTVVGLTRDPQRARRSNPAIAWHAWEPMLERPPAAAFEGVEGVVNLHGEKIAQRWSADAKRRILESRRTGTRNLLAAIAGLERKPGVLVSGSAIGYYGDRGDTPVEEDAEPGEGFDAEIVIAWEAEARRAEKLDLRLVVLRTGHVLAAEGGLLGELIPPFRLGLGGPIAGGRQYMSWIHIEDEVGILLWALDREDVSGTLNATAPNPVTNRELAQALGKALGRPAVVPVPGVALDLRFGREFGAILRGGQRVIPRRALDLGYEFRHQQVAEALRSLVA